MLEHEIVIRPTNEKESNDLMKVLESQGYLDQGKKTNNSRIC